MTFEIAEVQDMPHQTEKKTFFSLILLMCVIFTGGAIILYFIPYIGFSNIHKKLPLIIAVIFSAALLYFIGGAVTLVLTVVRGKNLFFNRRVRGSFIRLIFPVLVLIGKGVGISKEHVRLAFIYINNKLVLAEGWLINPEKMLILAPHCLQYHECMIRITGDIENCKSCGKCRIKDLVNLARKYHISVAVATGGTLARRIVKEKQPSLIIAIACERDLTSGIQDADPIPVFGILNDRPNGPCYDTDIDIKAVEKGISIFLKNQTRQ